MADKHHKGGRPAGASGSNDIARKATRPPGGVGGRSGTGQQQPHQRYDRDEAADTIVPGAIGAGTDADEPSQGGGSAIDREVRIQERKQQNDAGGRSGRHGAGGLDPRPGAPTKNR